MDLKLAGALLALVHTSGCADSGGGTSTRARGLDGTEASEHELAVLRASVLPYLRLDLVSTEVLPDPSSAAANNEYLRSLCSLSLASSVLRHHDDPPIARDEGAWLSVAADRFAIATSTTADTWWLAGSPGLDCLLAASAAGDAVSDGTRDKIATLAADLANRMVDDGRFVPDQWRARTRDAKDNSPAEEVGLAASFLAAAAHLLADHPSAERAAEWQALANDLVAYATERGDGAPFPADRWLVTNHGMAPHAVYTQSLLTSFGEIAAVHHQVEDAEAKAPTPDATATRAIGDAIDAAIDDDFRLTGSFEHIDARGTPIADGFPHEYERMTRVTAHHPAGSQLLIPTTDVGTMSQIVGPDGMLHTYQLRGDRIWKYTCKDGRCDAVFAHSIETQWRFITGNFDVPLPTRDIDALAQFWAGERIETYVYQGDRVWRYDCEAGTCRPEWTRTFAEQVAPGARTLWNGVPPPARVDAANHLYDPATNTVRIYWYAGDRVWAAKCENDVCEAFYTMPIAQQWDWVERRENYTIDLPFRDLGAITQYYDASHTLVTYIYQGDRLWKYLCAGGGCEAHFTSTLLEQFAAVRQQDRWAVDEIDRRTGVCDWGFDAALQNSAYAFLADRDSDGVNVDRYAALRAEQQERDLDVHPYFPPSATDGTFSWDEELPQDAFERIAPRSIRSLAGEWRDHLPTDRARWVTLDDQLYTHFWLNVLGAYNATIAYLLVAEPGHLEPF